MRTSHLIRTHLTASVSTSVGTVDVFEPHNTNLIFDCATTANICNWVHRHFELLHTGGVVAVSAMDNRYVVVAGGGPGNGAAGVSREKETVTRVLIRERQFDGSSLIEVIDALVGTSKTFSFLPHSFSGKLAVPMGFVEAGIVFGRSTLACVRSSVLAFACDPSLALPIVDDCARGIERLDLREASTADQWLQSLPNHYPPQPPDTTLLLLQNLALPSCATQMPVRV